jgi:hypothetical protein
VDLVSAVREASPETRQARIDALMRQMDEWGVVRLISAMDFFEAGVLSREEAEAVSSVDHRVFSQELSRRRRERRARLKRRG